MNVSMPVELALTQGNTTVVTDSTMAVLLKEMAALPSVDPQASRLVTVFGADYQWCREDLKRQAATLLRGLLTAARHQFYTQVELYKDQLLTVIENDQADRVQALVRTKLGYQGLTYQVPDDHPLPTYSFTVPIPSLVYQVVSLCTDERYELQWLFQRLEEFPTLIPPAAMLALEVLDQHNIVPSDYWIADKVLMRRYEQKSLDPALCVQFGRRFIGIAEWV